MPDGQPDVPGIHAEILWSTKECSIMVVNRATRSPISAVQIDDATLIRRGESMLAAYIGQEIVMMHMTSGRYVGLDDISGDIWRRLEGPCTFGDLIDKLEADYDADRKVIADDVRNLLTEMLANDIVQLDVKSVQG
ncbi:MAG: PqqD family protein [Pseudolabrys sp.]